MKTQIKIGDKFGRLTVIALFCKTKAGGNKWACLCECGGKKNVVTHALWIGKTRSCGCLYREARPFANRKHGESRKTSEYKAWAGMKYRCYDPNNKAYHNYGGRGIYVCDRWLGRDGYNNFISDMGRKPSANHSLDRKDVNGGYTPDNCRWATPNEQARNRTDNVWVEHNGKKMILSDWAVSLGASHGNMIRMAKKKGWDETIRFYNNASIQE